MTQRRTVMSPRFFVCQQFRRPNPQDSRQGRSSFALSQGVSPALPAVLLALAVGSRQTSSVSEAPGAHPDDHSSQYLRLGSAEQSTYPRQSR